MSYYGEWYRELMVLGSSSWQDHLLDEVDLHSILLPWNMLAQSHHTCDGSFVLTAVYMHADHSRTQQRAGEGSSGRDAGR